MPSLVDVCLPPWQTVSPIAQARINMSLVKVLLVICFVTAMRKVRNAGGINHWHVYIYIYGLVWCQQIELLMCVPPFFWLYPYIAEGKRSHVSSYEGTNSILDHAFMILYKP